MKSFRTRMQDFAVSQMLEYMDENPKEYIPMALNWLKRMDVGNVNVRMWDMLARVCEDSSNNYTELMVRALSAWNRRAKSRFIESFLCNVLTVSTNAVKLTGRKYGIHVPNAMVVEPVSASCGRGEYVVEASLDYKVMERIVLEAKELGIYMFIFSGNDPFLRKYDILKLCERNPDCYFLAFTDGGWIDEKAAKDIQKVANLAIALHTEGLKGEMDKWCGRGVFDKWVKSMGILKKYGLPFGVSVCYRRDNVEFVGSDVFLDFMIEHGAMFAWYLPFWFLGNKEEHVPLPSQQRFMYGQMLHFRKTKPIAVLDFMDGKGEADRCLVHECRYLYVDARGDVRPCALVPSLGINVEEKSLLEILRLPLFVSHAGKSMRCPLVERYVERQMGWLAEKCESVVHQWSGEPADCLVDSSSGRMPGIRMVRQR